MDNDVRVSVCCLCYNHGKYIRQAIESMVHQKTNFKYEIIIHDDASTDNSADIIREYEAKYPDLVKGIYQTENQHSRGCRLHLMYTLPIVKGHYILFFDCDDYWCDDDKLQKQFDVMEAHPECSICVHKVAFCDEKGVMTGETLPKAATFKQGVLDDEIILNILFPDGYPFQTSSFFIRKSEQFQKILKQDFAYSGDSTFIFIAACLGKIFYIDEAMTVYREFSQNSWGLQNRSLSVHDRLDKRINKTLKLALQINDVSNGKLKKYIEVPVFRKIVRQWGVWDPKLEKEFLLESGLKYSEVKKDLDFVDKLYYYLIMYFPFVLKVIRFRRKKKLKKENKDFYSL